MMPRKRKLACRPGAYSLIELVMVLGLMGVFGLVAAHLWADTFALYSQYGIAQKRVCAYESALRQMRIDTWSASAIQLSDAGQAQLALPGRRSVTWRIDKTGALLREVNSAAAGHWDDVAGKLRFGRDGPCLLLMESGEDPALATRLPSQVLIEGGAR